MNKEEILKRITAIADGDEVLAKETIQECKKNMDKSNSLDLDSLREFEDEELFMYLYYLIGKLDTLDKENTQ